MVYHNEDGSITSNAAPRVTTSTKDHPAILEERAAYEATIARLTAELEAAREKSRVLQIVIDANIEKHRSRAQTAEALLLRAYEAGRDDAALEPQEQPRAGEGGKANG